MFFSLWLSSTNNYFLMSGCIRTVIILAVLIFLMAWFREVRQIRAPGNLWFIEAWRAIRFSWAIAIGLICTLSTLLSLYVVLAICQLLYFVVYLHF